MDDLETLTAQLKLNPSALDLRMMWRDCYQDRHGCSAEDAKRECAGIWVPVLEQYYEESACVLVHELGQVHSNARWLIRRATPFPVPRTVRIAITRGFLSPCRPDEDARWRQAVIGVSYSDNGKFLVLHRLRERPSVVSVLVGARWVIDLAQKHKLVWSYTSAEDVYNRDEEKGTPNTTPNSTEESDAAEENETE